jgi:hypothetical protein
MAVLETVLYYYNSPNFSSAVTLNFVFAKTNPIFRKPDQAGAS